MKNTSVPPTQTELIGFCGTSCGRCACRIATVTHDPGKKQIVAQKWSRIYHTPLTPEMISCTGCQEPGAKFMYPQSECAVRPCVLEKHFHTCAECGEYPCAKITELHSENPKAKVKITLLRKNR